MPELRLLNEMPSPANWHRSPEQALLLGCCQHILWFRNLIVSHHTCTNRDRVHAGKQYLAFLEQARESLRMGLPNFIKRDFASWRDIAKLPATLAAVLPSLRRISLLQILGPHDSM
jgi:hypothetical protein